MDRTSGRRPRARPAAERWDVLLAIAVGGAAGASARYGLSLAFPYRPQGFPFATLLANVAGCVLIGALMAAITEATSPHRLLRPFFGIGVLGGFTTFSTYVVEVIGAGASGKIVVVLGYGLGTVLASLAAVVAGLVLTRALLRPRKAGNP